MDIYAIICIFALVAQCIWHAIIGAIIFVATPDNKLTPSMWYTHFDRYVFIAMIIIFIVLQILLITWLYQVPLKHRKNMDKKDIEYQLSISKKKNGENNKFIGKNVVKTVPFSRIPIGTEI
jgi:hypothetical protein